jgi:hypothetical protein
VPTRQAMTRRTVTEGSVLVLPSYPLAFSLLGAALLLQSAARTASPAFDSAKWVMGWAPLDPIRAWSFIFLAIGITEAVAGLAGRRRAFTWLLVAGAGVCAFWATLLFWSAGSNPVVSFTAGIWVSHSAWCHIASVRSLSRDWVVKS